MELLQETPPELIGQLVEQLPVLQENEYWAMECLAARVTGRNW